MMLHIYDMEFPSLKRKKGESGESDPETEGVPQTLITTNPVFLSRESHKFVAFHCNTIYTGSRIRVWKPFSLAEQGRIAYVFWKCTNGLFVHFEDTDFNEFIDVSPGHRFVVDNRAVSVGALRIMCRKNTDDTVLENNTLSHDNMNKHYKGIPSDRISIYGTIHRIRIPNLEI